MYNPPLWPNEPIYYKILPFIDQKSKKITSSLCLFNPNSEKIIYNRARMICLVKKILKSYDFTLIAVIVCLSVFGLVMVYSSSMVTAVQRWELPSDFFYLKQLRHLIFGLIVFVIMAIIWPNPTPVNPPFPIAT